MTLKMCQAAAEGNLQQMQVLLRAGADPSNSDYDDRTPMHLAAAHDHLLIMEYIKSHHPTIDLNAVDAFDTTPLNDAFSTGCLATIDWLVARGAEMGTTEQAHRDLFNGCVDGDADIVKKAAAAGIDLDLADYDDRTPLMLAASEGKTVVVRALLGAGADMHKIDRWGQNALQSAVSARQEEVVRVLNLAQQGLSFKEEQ
jgi:hyperpolarization activated cyclic nucleotide-gated potassium channel 4